MRPAFDEIARRKAAAAVHSSQETVSYFEPSDDAITLPFELPEQDYVLVTMGTAVLAPRPVDMTKPCMRVYGAFASKADAQEHAEVVMGLDPQCSMLVVRRNTWVLLPQTEMSRDDPEENRRRVERRLAAHRAKRAEEEDAFDRALHENVERSTPKTVPVDGEEQREEADAEKIVYPPPRRLRAGGEVRGQGAVALCIIPDESGGECLVKVLGCFENTTEGENWVRNVATRVVTADDVLLTGTCDWFYPNASRVSAGRELYRNKELQKIMDAAARNPKNVKRYKEWKAEQDRAKAEQNVIAHTPSVCVDAAAATNEANEANEA